MRIEHVAMYVSNLEKTRAFFEKYFGGKAGALYHNPKTDFQSYFLTFEDGARLEIMNKPEIGNFSSSDESTGLGAGTGYAHIAFSVGSREKVDEITSRLLADGYEVTSGPRVTGDGYYESCVVGVEGNVVEVTV